MLWDIFCKVIDNFGDVGVCWRLCADLAERRQQVRLWIDDASALDWMAPGARQGRWTNIAVYPWTACSDPQTLGQMPPADVWIEGFGCEITPEFIALHAHSAGLKDRNTRKSPVWINLEYLSAEAYVETCHGLPSPVMHGPGKGLQKYFYYPGFTTRTGGLLREPHIAEQRRQWDSACRAKWLQKYGIAWNGERCISLFCYEPPALAGPLQTLANASEPSLLLVTAGRAQAALNTAWSLLGWSTSSPQMAGNVKKCANLTVYDLPLLNQGDFDRLLWTCDFNFVRGEDSLVRAVWAGKPFIWQIYPQEDGAHHEKLAAFLDQTGAPDFVREAHVQWNQPHASYQNGPSANIPPWNALPNWQDFSKNLLSRMEAMPDLTTQLMQFVEKKR